jgi:hypothetical protein
MIGRRISSPEALSFFRAPALSDNKEAYGQR